MTSISCIKLLLTTNPCNNFYEGLRIDSSTAVLKQNGAIIRNLFAAGEVTGGVHGANRLAGT